MVCVVRPRTLTEHKPNVLQRKERSMSQDDVAGVGESESSITKPRCYSEPWGRGSVLPRDAPISVFTDTASSVVTTNSSGSY